MDFDVFEKIWILADGDSVATKRFYAAYTKESGRLRLMLFFLS